MGKIISVWRGMRSLFHLSSVAAHWYFLYSFPFGAAMTGFLLLFSETPLWLTLTAGVIATAAAAITFHYFWVMNRLASNSTISNNKALSNSTESHTDRKRQLIDDCRKLIADWGFDHNQRSQRQFLEENENFW